MSDNFGPGYQKFREIAKRFKRTTTPPAKDYSTFTLAELHAFRDKATDWLKDNIDHPMFEEANRRYMEIEDTIQLKEAENIFGANSGTAPKQAQTGVLTL
mgnify:CR=1 FL=1